MISQQCPDDMVIITDVASHFINMRSLLVNFIGSFHDYTEKRTYVLEPAKQLFLFLCWFFPSERLIIKHIVEHIYQFMMTWSGDMNMYPMR